VFIPKEIVMLFCSKVQADLAIKTPAQADTQTIDNKTVVLGGGFRLPVRIVDNGTVRLGGGFRLPFQKT
jgi:hypothetical protein